MEKVWAVYGRTPQHETFFICYCVTKADAIKERTAWLKYNSWKYAEVWFEETGLSEKEFDRYFNPGMGW